MNKLPKKIVQNSRRYALFLLTTWTVIVCVSILWNIHHIHTETVEKARIEARTIFEHNIAYRKWNTSLGGVYAEITPHNQPNPYLDIAHREIHTETDLDLTLINPFQMTRMAYKLLAEESKHPTLNRTVSMKPLNPENTPDAWEKKGLAAFEKGVPEISEVTTINNKPYMRLLQPYITVAGCLKCHGDQGYEVGDIRGGMSIAVPMAPYFQGEDQTRKTIFLTHTIMWLIGAATIILFTQSTIKKQQHIFRSEEQFRVLAEFANDWEYWISDDNRIIFTSPSCEVITGYSPDEFHDTPGLLEKIIHPDSAKVYQQTLLDTADAATREIEFMIRRKDGSNAWIAHKWRTIYIDGAAKGRRVSNRDITTRKNLEEQLLQSQKMESLGLLAGGMAHDFNNLLTGITGYASLLQIRLPDANHDTQRFLQNILKAAENAQSLTTSLLAFSRKQINNPSVIKLNAVIQGVSSLLHRLIGEDITLKMRYAPKEFPIFADPHQFEQVIMNLSTNARDAMPHGGQLIIETAAVTISSSEADKHDAAPGEYMKISVRDTGQGISKEILPNIFDPFFTTKDKGKGTGLGLSMIYGIVKQHEGFITVYSERGVGTSFNVYIPRASESAYSMIKDGESDPFPDDFHGTATILIAEDEGTVREFLQDTLQLFGYSIISAADGEEAIARYNEEKATIDLAVLDVIMPKKNGMEVHQYIKRDNPAVKTIFISGYAKDILTAKGIYEEGLEYLPKPLSTKELMTRIVSVLRA